MADTRGRMAAGEEQRKQALLQGPIRRIQRRMNLEVWAHGLIAPAWCAATGAALYRLVLRVHAPLAALAFLALAAAYWVVRTRPRLLTLSQAAVLADRGAQAGGLLLTRLEVPVGAWELALNERVRRVRPPAVALRRPLSHLALALAFTVLVLLLPLPAPASRHVNAAAATKLAQVESLAETLAREVPLGDDVRAELERLAAELSEGNFGAADWEAADGVEAALQKQAAAVAAELARAAEAARALEEGLAARQGAESLRAQEEELERALMALGSGQQAGTGQQDGRTPGQQDGGSKEGKPGTRPDSGRSPGEVSALRRALEQRQQQLAQGRDGRDGVPREGAGSREGREGRSSKKGKYGAGPGRGGGPRPLTFSGNEELHPERLKFAPLPEGQGGETGELWGLRGADPQPDMEASRGGPPGTVAEGESSPGQRWGPLLPRNRELVQRYFESP